MDPIQPPQASLNEEEGCRRVNVKVINVRKARLAIPSMKREGINTPITMAALRNWKMQENEFFLEPPENSATPPTLGDFLRDTHFGLPISKNVR